MNNNPTAFPYMEISEDGVTLENHSGMTLRDWFAGQVDLSAYSPTMTFKIANNRNPTIEEMAQYVALIRFMEADAMLSARKESESCSE